MQSEAILDMFADVIATRVAERVADRVGVANPVQQRLLTVPEAAAYLGRSKSSIQHLVSSGGLPTVRSDTRVFFDILDLNAWIDANKSSA